MNAKRTELDDLKSYPNTLEQIKNDIQQSQLRAALSITRELAMLYWRIGKLLSEKIAQEEWGLRR